MAPSSRAKTLLEKIHDLPADELVKVEDFVDFLRQRQQRNLASPEERLRHAAETGRLTPPHCGTPAFVYHHSQACDRPR
jgi:hypothetical protein